MFPITMPGRLAALPGGRDAKRKMCEWDESTR